MFFKCMAIILGVLVLIIVAEVCARCAHYRAMTRGHLPGRARRPVPAPDLEDQPMRSYYGSYGSIDMYQSAKIALVLYAEILASELEEQEPA